MGGQLDSCRLGKAEAVGMNMDVLSVSGKPEDHVFRLRGCRKGQ